MRKDVEIHIPIRLDTPDRVDIYDSTVRWIKKYYPDIYICVVESDDTPRVNADNPKIHKYCFIKSENDFFKKSSMLNTLAKESEAEIICQVDIDCILDPIINLDLAVELCKGNYTMVNPFGLFECYVLLSKMPAWNISLDIDYLKEVDFICSKEFQTWGGWVVLNRERYLEAGGHNPIFVSWGPDDQELPCRLEKLGYQVGRVEGKIYHQFHERKQHSTQNHLMFCHNEAEFNRIKNISVEELRKEVKTWK